MLVLFASAFGYTDQGFWLNYDVTLKVHGDVQRTTAGCFYRREASFR